MKAKTKMALSGSDHTLKGLGEEYQRAADGRFMHDLRQLEEILAWEQGVSLEGLTIKRDEQGWFVLLKVKKGETALVHFSGARQFTDALENLIWEISGERLTWRPDKFA